MPSQKSSRCRALALVFLAACAGGPDGNADRDPFADAKFAELTSETLRTDALPDGYRLGDRAPAKTPDQPSPTPPWRTTRDPNPTTLFVAARGKDSRVDYVQWVFEGGNRPSIQLVTDAGIRQGDVVALGRARPRNWGRLSQGHAQDERFEVYVQATDRPGLYLQRMAYDGALDSLVWSASIPTLLAEDERFPIADALTQLATAMAARDEATVSKYRHWLKCVPNAAIANEVAAAEALLVAWAKEHDDPLLTQLESIARRHDAEWPTQGDDARIRAWATDHEESIELWRKLKRAESDVPTSIQAQWQAFANERAAPFLTAVPDSAVGHFWRYVVAKPRTHTEVVDGWVRANELDNVESMYFQTVDLRTRLAEGDTPLLPPTRDVDEVVRRLLARQLRREVESDRKTGNPLRADWIERGILRDLETLVVRADQRYPFVTGGEYLKLWNDVTRYALSTGGDVRVGLRVLALNALAQEEAKAFPVRAQRTGFASTFMTDFIAKERETIAKELRAQAATSAAAGYFATAAVHALQADDVMLRSPDAVQSLSAPTENGSVLSYARQFLARVLPPIDANTAQGVRLCQLLAENDTAEWPLVRDLAVALAPDDVPKLRAELGLPATFAHLVKTGNGDEVALVEKPTPSDPKTDERFWAAYSGRSKELIDENAWISGESSWIRPESEWLDTEEAAIEIEVAQMKQELEVLDGEFEAHKANRAGINTYDGNAVQAYNGKSNELDNKKTAYNKKAEANRTRVAAYNTRVEAHRTRVKEFNRRLAAYNEKRMREDAAGHVALDAKLKPAVVAAIRQGLSRWEADVLATLPNGLARDMELLFGKSFLGQHESRAELWTRPVGKGYARIVADWALRAGPQQSTNREYAQHVVRWWQWAVLADVKDREAILDVHLQEFVAHRDLQELKTVIDTACAGDAVQRAFLQRRLEEQRQQFFAPKK